MKNVGPSFLKVERKEFEWCHVCGQRYSGNWAELWISENAEHGHEATRRSKYVRLCGDCARQISESVRVGEVVKVVRHPFKPPTGIHCPSPTHGKTGIPDDPDDESQEEVDLDLREFVVLSSLQDPMILCPSCEGAQIHLGPIQVDQGKDKYAVGKNLAVHAEATPESQVRGSIVTMNLWCEEGHRCQIEFRFHKGSTYFRCIPLKDFDPEKDNSFPELWRD